MSEPESERPETKSARLIKLYHPTDPRYLIAPHELPDVITFFELRDWRYGKLMIAQAGEVVATYYYDNGDWKKKPENKSTGGVGFPQDEMTRRLQARIRR